MVLFYFLRKYFGIFVVRTNDNSFERHKNMYWIDVERVDPTKIGI